MALTSKQLFTHILLINHESGVAEAQSKMGVVSNLKMSQNTGNFNIFMVK